MKQLVPAPEALRTIKQVERHVRTGRPYGCPTFLAALEHVVGYRLHRLPTGPNPRKELLCPRNSPMQMLLGSIWFHETRVFLIYL